MLEFDQAKYSPLHFCLARKEFLSLIEVILEYVPDCNVDCVNALGNTPLMLAVMNDDYDIARILLQHRANPNIKNKDGILMVFLSFLIEPTINHLLNDTLVPPLCYLDAILYSFSLEEACLHITCSEGQYEMTLLLLLSNAHCNITDKDQRTPLHRFPLFL